MDCTDKLRRKKKEKVPNVQIKIADSPASRITLFHHCTLETSCDTHITIIVLVQFKC